MPDLLLLGGTSEARACAAELVRRGFDVVSSLAGRVAAPRLPAGAVRIGGFGGPDAMARWLAENRVRAVVDATHPFAERIGTSAVTACASAGVPLLRLRRPGWQAGPSDRWHWVDSLDAAAGAVATLGERAFVTTGRQGIAAFAGLNRTWLLIRCVDPPAQPLPPHCRILLSRGPYEVTEERELMTGHGIDVLVTKDSGGTMTAAKLAAARELGIPTVVVRRPPRPPAHTVATPPEALRWVAETTAAQERQP